MLGQACAFKKKEVYKGRGYEAPKNVSESHRSGSQGKH